MKRFFAGVVLGATLLASSANAAVIVLKLTGDASSITTQNTSIPGLIRQAGQLVLSFTDPNDPLGFPFVIHDGDEIQAEVTVTGGSFVVPANADMLFGLDFIGGSVPGNIMNGKVFVNGDMIERDAGCGNCLNFITAASPTGVPFAINSLTASGIAALTANYTVEGMSLTFQSQTAIPEPTTWALMILGFGSAGAMLRRRRQSLTFAGT